MDTVQKRWMLHEDWAVVVLGLLSIGAVLLGLVLPVPSFNWGTIPELSATVLAAKNLWAILWQCLFVFTVAAIGAVLTGKPVKNFLLGFPAVYGLTLIALIVAGNAAVRGLNLESVSSAYPSGY